MLNIHEIQTYYSDTSRETKKRKIQRVFFVRIVCACVWCWYRDVRQFLCQQLNFLLSISKLLFAAAIILFDE